jgi:hypothetical protein
MATRVIRWQAADGEEFTSEEAANNHDLIVEISEGLSYCVNLRIALNDMLNAGYKIIPPPKATHDPRG